MAAITGRYVGTHHCYQQTLIGCSDNTGRFADGSEETYTAATVRPVTPSGATTICTNLRKEAGESSSAYAINTTLLKHNKNNTPLRYAITGRK